MLQQAKRNELNERKLMFKTKTLKKGFKDFVCH